MPEAEENSTTYPWTAFERKETIDRHCAPGEAPGHCLLCRLRKLETFITVSEPEKEGGIGSVTIHTNCICSAEERRTIRAPGDELLGQSTNAYIFQYKDCVTIRFKSRTENLLCGWRLCYCPEYGVPPSGKDECAEAEHDITGDLQELAIDEDLPRSTAQLKDEVATRTLDGEELAQEASDDDGSISEIDPDAYYAHLLEGLKCHMDTALTTICHDKIRWAKHELVCRELIEELIKSMRIYKFSNISSILAGPDPVANPKESEL